MSENKTINDRTELEGDFRYLDDKTLELRHDNINYVGHIQPTADPKIYKVEINGREHTIQIQSELDVLIDKMGLNVIEDKNASDVFSPMPGLVIDIMVKEGDEIEEGDPLLILEAMKMENIIKAAGKGVVGSIKVAKGDKIDKAQILITIDATHE